MAQEKGLHRVVHVVAQGGLVGPQLLQPVMKCALAQLHAEGAGVLLLPLPKDHVADVAVDDVVRHAQAAAVVRHGGKVHAREAQVHGDAHQFEGLGIIAAERMEGAEQRHAVLPPGEAHGDHIPRGYHSVVFHAAAHKSGELFHKSGTVPSMKNENRNRDIGR